MYAYYTKFVLAVIRLFGSFHPHGWTSLLPNGPRTVLCPVRRNRLARLWIGCAGILAVVCGSGVVKASDTSLAVIGGTPAVIHSRFAGVIYNNLNNTQATARLARLTNVELQDLAYAYARNTGGNVNALTQLIQVRAPSQVARFTPMAAVALAGWAGTNTVYRARMMLAVRASPPLLPPAPTLDMTLQEIYLEFRTATVGSLSVESSVFSTISYAAKNLTLAYSAGYLIGSGVHWLIEAYAPEWDNKIGGLMDTLITDITLAPSQFAYYEYYLDQDVFWVPITDLQNSGDFGDWGIFDAMSDIWFYLAGDCMSYPYC